MKPPPGQEPLPQARILADSDGEADPDAHEAEHREFVVPANAHLQRLDKVLAEAAPEFSRGHLQGLIEGGQVQVDGVLVAHNAHRLRHGQRVRALLLPTAETLSFRPQPMSLQVLFEDEHLLVIDKPAGLVVHPAAGHWSGTLLNGLLAHHEQAAQLPRAGIVHRLDKDTSGVMVVGKTLPAVTALVRDIAVRAVQRQYLALAWGKLERGQTHVDAPIGRHPSQRTRMAVVATGRPAQTDIDCVASHGGISALRCRLHTGRTHQIRVHLAWRKHPLVADALYGGRPALDLHRQALHATRLAFEHPTSRQALVFDCAPPPDFAAAWAAVMQG